MTKASCECSQEDWCFFDHFLLMLFGPCLLMLLWLLGYLGSWILFWHLGFLVLGIYLKTICRSASSLIKINNMIVNVSNEVPP